ncbi:MAG: hypothetical protein RPU34_10410 [Candidatus Sedimenticola sp. (ex Thyasira tokunagai)]
MTMHDIQQQQYLEMLANSRMNEAQIKSARTVLEDIGACLPGYHEQRTHIMNDDRLSDAGKGNDLATLSQGTYENIKRLTTTEIKQLDKRIAELEYVLRPQAPNTDTVVEHLKQKEVRDLLRKKDELETMALYEELAVSGTNDLVMRAIEEAPLPLISDQSIIEAGRRARAERQSPEEATLLTQLKQWRSIVDGRLNSARAELGIADDTLQVINETGAV